MAGGSTGREDKPTEPDPNAPLMDTAIGTRGPITGGTGFGSKATAKVGGQEMTWTEITKKYGMDKAASLAPELDPRYQELIKSEGQGKGSADYAHKYLDPSTVTAKGWSGMGSMPQIQEGIAAEKAKGGLIPGLLGTIGSIETNNGASPLSGVGTALFGGGGTGGAAGATPGTGKAGKTTAPVLTPAQQLQKQEQAIASSPASQMMDGLINQYKAAQAEVDPYISGAVSGADTKAAGAIGQSIGGATGPQPAAAKGINDMLASDAAAYAKSNDAGAAGQQTALKDLGTANAEYLQVAPYAGLLNALQSEAQYKQETGSGTMNVQNAPAWLKQAYQNVIGSSTTTGGAAPVGTPNPAAVTATTPSTNTPTVAGGGNG